MCSQPAGRNIFIKNMFFGNTLISLKKNSSEINSHEINYSSCAQKQAFKNYFRMVFFFMPTHLPEETSRIEFFCRFFMEMLINVSHKPFNKIILFWLSESIEVKNSVLLKNFQLC